MRNSGKIFAVILAGGVGSRFDDNEPKQFLKLAGKSVLEHAVDIFAMNQNIDHIVIVLEEKFHDKWLEKLFKLNLSVPFSIVKSGATRNLSTRNALTFCSDAEFVIIHDAARPLLNQSIIDDCIAALSSYDAVDVAIDSSDTVIEVDEESHIKWIPQRSKLKLGQTPQAFRLKTISKAYANYDSERDSNLTDDCGVVLKYMPWIKIKVVQGSPTNIKITQPWDIGIADVLMHLKTDKTNQLNLTEMQTRLNNKVAAVFGGSSGIGLEIVKSLQAFGATAVSLSRSTSGTDVRNTESVSSSLEEIWINHGRIDFVVFSAGVVNSGEFEGMSMNRIRDIVETNFLGFLNVAQQSHRYLSLTKGHLLVIGSSSWSRGRPGSAVYSATKASVVNFVQGISAEWYSAGVRINVVNPDRTKTGLRSSSFEDDNGSKLLDAKNVGEFCSRVLCQDTTGQIFKIGIKWS